MIELFLELDSENCLRYYSRNMILKKKNEIRKEKNVPN